MGVLSKEKTVIRQFFYNILTNKKTGLPILGSLVLLFYIINYRNRKRKINLITESESNFSLKKALQKKKHKGTLNFQSLQNIFALIKIAIPNFFSKLTFEMILMMATLISRTLLSIMIAGINGGLVKSIIKRDLKSFAVNIIKMCAVAIPASFLNSYIGYLNKSIKFQIRENLTSYFHKRYIHNMRYYQVINIDSRIKNPDQKIAQDIKLFAESFANLYTNLVKPFLDMILFTKSLGDRLGYKTVSFTFIWYGFSGMLLRFVSPPMGILHAFQQNYEGELRSQFSNIKNHAQEIAFLDGSKWERNKVLSNFDQVYQHEKDILNKKLFLGMFDSMLVRYGATLVGYFILSKPTMRFLSGKKAPGSITNITGDYIKNGSMMINLAKAIGRFVVSYKDFQKILGYTELLIELKQVLDDLDNEIFIREVAQKKKTHKKNIKGNLNQSDMKTRGKIIITNQDVIEFKDVLIVTPNGNVLVDAISFMLKRGENLIISGPNGCGKSSLFRILGKLWPLISGEMKRPPIENLFYLPQRPYLSLGTLMEQIIYPNISCEKSDWKNIIEQLRFVDLGSLLKIGEEEKSLFVIKDWKQELGEGEKQRIAMARLLFHQPSFAILDECSSRVSAGMEQKFYQKTKELKISLFTIAHRASLFKFHDKYLKMDKNGVWELIELTEQYVKDIEEEHKINKSSESKNDSQDNQLF